MNAPHPTIQPKDSAHAAAGDMYLVSVPLFAAPLLFLSKVILPLAAIRRNARAVCPSVTYCPAAVIFCDILYHKPWKKSTEKPYFPNRLLMKS
jgi:hypothetical protein